MKTLHENPAGAATLANGLPLEWWVLTPREVHKISALWCLVQFLLLFSCPCTIISGPSGSRMPRSQLKREDMAENVRLQYNGVVLNAIICVHGEVFASDCCHVGKENAVFNVRFCLFDYLHLIHVT